MDRDRKKINDYSYNITQKPLGKGAFGTVYKGINDLNQKEVAIKVISSDLLQKKEYREILQREVEVLSQLKGDNIVQMLANIQTKNNLYICMEFCNGGNMEEYLMKHNTMSEDKALEVAYQFCKAFNTINDLSIKDKEGKSVVIMHRDLKTANILFHNGVVKIADFGFAKMVDEKLKDKKHRHTLLGTPLYMAPQILDDQPYTSKCDIWSSGVIIYECLYGKLPWEGSSMSNLLKNIVSKPLVFHREIKPETKDLLQKMLQVSETRRISWEELLKHPAIEVARVAYEGRQNIKISEPQKVIEVKPEKENMSSPFMKRSEPADQAKMSKEEFIKAIETFNKPEESKRISENKTETMKEQTQTTPRVQNRHTVEGGRTEHQQNQQTTEKRQRSRSPIFAENKKVMNLPSNIFKDGLPLITENNARSDHRKQTAPLPNLTDFGTKDSCDGIEERGPTTPKKYIPIFSKKKAVCDLGDPSNPWKLPKQIE